MRIVTVPDDEWERSDPTEPSRLHTDLLVNGVPMRMHALPVRTDDSRGFPVQEYVGPYAEAFRALEAICDAEGPYAAVTIRGRPYVLVACPYGE